MAAASVGTVALNVIANTAQFTQGIQGVRTQVATLPNVIGSATSGLTSFASKILGLVGVSVGAAAAIKSLSSAMDSIDKVAKLSDATGISTERLVGLQHAAGLAGSSTDELNSSLNKMVKNVGAAVNGGAAQIATFERLGLSVDELRNTSPDLVFGQIADAINALPTPAERAAAAVEIFGRSGQNLLPLLATGSKGIEEMQQQAEQLGMTFSRVDAAKVEAANDSITRLKGAFSGLANVAAVRLAPYIDRLVTGMEHLIVWLRNLDTQTIQNAIKIGTFAAAMGAALLIVPRIITAVGSMIRAFRALAAGQALVQALSGPAGWATLAVSVGVAAAAVYGVGKAFDGVEESVAAVKAKAPPAVDAIAESAKEAADEARRVSDEMARMKSEADAIAQSVRTPFEVAEDGIRRAQELFDNGFLNAQVLDRAVVKIGEDYIKAIDGAKDLQRQQENRGIDVVKRGSAAAFNSEQQIQRAFSQQIENRKQELAEQKEHTKLLKQLLAAAKAKPSAVVLNEAGLGD